MRYREGALLFYAALAEQLLPEVGAHTSVQLVVPDGASPPEHDCLGVAFAISTRDRDPLQGSATIDGQSADPLTLPDLPLVIDCRGMNSASAATAFREPLRTRNNIVLVTESEIALLGSRVVLFSSNSDFVFNAISDAFAELLSQFSLRQRTGDLLMPARFLSRGLRGIQDDFHLFEDGDTPPLSGASLDRYCASISRTWTFQERVISGPAVVQWVRQFEQYDAVREAVDLLTYLNRSGYLPKGEIVNKIVGKYRELCCLGGSKPELVSIQPIGKSEAMLCYDLREIQNAPAKLFRDVINGSRVEHIVCCNDVIGSGQTILECLFEGGGTVSRSDVLSWLALKKSRLSLLVAIASEHGVRNIEGDARCLGKVKVYAAR